jgi:hypothetical protein
MPRSLSSKWRVEASKVLSAWLLLAVLLLSGLLLPGRGLRAMNGLFRQAHLFRVEPGQQALKLHIVLGVGQLKPVLRTRQKRLLDFVIGYDAGEFGAFGGCHPA